VALQCRLTAGSIQLSVAEQELKMKQLLIAETLVRLTNWGATEEQSSGAASVRYAIYFFYGKF
jgi:hypothetical protein